MFANLIKARCFPLEGDGVGFEEGVSFRQSSSFPAAQAVDSWAATVVRCPKTSQAMEHSSQTIDTQKTSPFT